jgi:hypothetical protein
MIIGGIDICIPTTSNDTLQKACSILLTWWPDAVIETPDGEQFKSIKNIDFNKSNELFVYVDQAWADEDDLFDKPDSENKMIHLIKDKKYLTVVVDSERYPISTMLQHISNAVV